MSSQKQSRLHVEEDREKGHASSQGPSQTEREIYHEDGAILVDLAATQKGDQTVALKTARDGHVCHTPRPIYTDGRYGAFVIADSLSNRQS